jgi:hypothetical protein
LNCPFCQNQVLPKAYVCGHCGRDLVPWLSLLTQLDQQNQRVERLEKTLGLPSDLNSVAPKGQTAHAVMEWPDPPPISWHVHRLLMGILVSAALLWGAHWLLLFVYDASPLLLRIVTMLVPLLVALALNARGDVDWRSNLLASCVLSMAGVAGMLGITAWIDEVPWLPTSKRDGIETFEYTIAIQLAWVTGHLVGLALNKGQRLLFEKRQLANATLGQVGPRIKDVSEQLQKLAAAAAPVASGLIAAYSGLKSLVGDGGP